MDLCTLIDRNAAFAPNKAAIHFEGETLSYAALRGSIEQAARALNKELRVTKGDRVAILSLNRPEYLILLYACARLGAIMLPLNWRLAPAEQLFILSNAGARVLVVEQAFNGLLPHLAHTLPDTSVVGLDFTPPRGSTWGNLLAQGSGDSRNSHADLSCPLLIVYTSGSTGRPKGAVLRQEALLWNGMMSQHMHALTSEDHVLSVLPFFHVGGLNIQTTPALHHGATVTIHSRFAAGATLTAFEHDRPTLTALVPTAIQTLTDHAAWWTADLYSLKAISTGSTIVSQALIERVTARGVPVLQVYGSTETCPIAIYTRLGGDLSRCGSIGLPGLCCDAMIIDDAGKELPAGAPGEIAVRGPNVFCEYWGDHQATREALCDGWYRTGDIGHRDAGGYYWVRDRKKNLIISGGENIYPAEVERVLGEHPDVKECAVVGRSDSRWGEVPVAYVVRRVGARIEAEALAAHVQSQVARFKVPQEFIFTRELPRTALGKIQYSILKELQARSSEQEGSN
ncbi:class I adenylate-forming enzyme family protein [Rhizobium ruizarguesonis]|uniref:class I adenylate-forming enzyme family protein n=1 Tax=Rhizobium ruizarguesonis TaxID=2081791 RepID=UPI0013DFE4A0|nr:AMP-binding protein [Rhizobium ruizarguesonis]MBY5891559.1 long-chain fatty acid--CoA ligase [Rhizobium leguminosarum]NEI81993.1 AMP-binding protein [Rhizobium ruizarguesonis]QSZ05875.1 AMP-binding protein [Rhizobium ruizarguesonis]